MKPTPMVPSAPRIPCVAPCYIAGGSVIQGTTCNISTRGVFLAVDPVPEPGARLRISFSLPDEAEPVGADVRVVWLNPPSPAKGKGSRAPKIPPGCGLEFLDIDDEDLERIRAHVTAVKMQRAKRARRGRSQPETARPSLRARAVKPKGRKTLAHKKRPARRRA